MPTCVCACGAKYRFTDQAFGKKARCKRCGQAITLQPGSDEDEHPSETKPITTTGLHEDTEDQPDDALTIWEHSRARGFWGALGWSFLFPASVNNLLAFLTLWAVFGFLDCLPLPRISIFYFVVIFWFIVWGWFAAFRVEVIHAAAAGQFRLPDVAVSADLWGDFIEPAVYWYGSWIIALSPPIAYCIAQGYRGNNVLASAWQALNPVVGVTPPPLDAALVSLTIVGLFFWPLIVLVVVIGGFGYLWRFDRVLHTLGNTFAPYCVVVVVVFVTYGGALLSKIFLSPPPLLRAATPAALGMFVLLTLLNTAIELYATIVASRAIGVYFRHFGHRFAWDWGQTNDRP